MKQLRILHFTDIHFGSNFRCLPEDPTHPQAGFPDLFDLLKDDLSSSIYSEPAWSRPSDVDAFAEETGGPDTLSPLLVIVTGDLTQKADRKEFSSADVFLRRFGRAELLGSKVTLKDLFITLGNHDVDYGLDDIESRVTPYANFYTKLFSGIRPPVAPHEARRLTQVHVDEARGFIVAEVNTALYVQRGTPDEQRGCVDMETIQSLDKELGAVPKRTLNACARVAIMHHHPILVPELVEAGREYDAVANSRHLLSVLRRHGFHLVLHGHKHYPHLFSYDSDSFLQKAASPSMLVCGGGSLASRELPNGLRRNTYSVISLKWHPEASQARVRVLTRGLVAEEGAGEMAPHLWTWETLRDADRLLASPKDPPTPKRSTVSQWQDMGQEAIRKGEYDRTRLNMAVCSIMPSLVPGQAYEVRFWIVPHCGAQGDPRPGWTPPEKVIWSAGPLFPMKTCERADDPLFCGAFNYWGPMVIQAELHFEGGGVARTHVYARVPGLYLPPDP